MLQVIVRYKLNFLSCTAAASWACHCGNCGNQSFIVQEVSSESGAWCQKEGLWAIWLLPSNAAFQLL